MTAVLITVLGWTAGDRSHNNLNREFTKQRTPLFIITQIIFILWFLECGDIVFKNIDINFIITV